MTIPPASLLPNKEMESFVACLKVEFADEVNLAGGEDHDGNLPQGWDMDW